MTAKKETGLINQQDAVAKDCKATYKLTMCCSEMPCMS